MAHTNPPHHHLLHRGLRCVLCSNAPAVLACSALKPAYRQLLRTAEQPQAGNASGRTTDADTATAATAAGVPASSAGDSASPRHSVIACVSGPACCSWAAQQIILLAGYMFPCIQLVWSVGMLSMTLSCSFEHYHEPPTMLTRVAGFQHISLLTLHCQRNEGMPAPQHARC
jgi:hypothetical protein